MLRFPEQNKYDNFQTHLGLKSGTIDTILNRRDQIITRIAISTLIGGIMGTVFGVASALLTGGLASPVIPLSAAIGAGIGSSLGFLASSVTQVAISIYDCMKKINN